MKIHHTFIITSLCIFLFRIIDLTTTYYATTNFRVQEQNILVKFLNLDIWEFFALKIVLVLGVIGLYLYSEKFYSEFKIKAASLKLYITLFLYGKETISLMEFLFKIKYKRIAILFGSIAPMFIIATSVVYILNNLWVNAVDSGCDIAFKSYYFLNDYYFFEIVLLCFPPLFLTYLVYKRLNNRYLKNKLSPKI